MNSPTPLYKYLRQKKDGVADLVTKVNSLNTLNREMLSIIPPPLNEHVKIAKLEGNCLFLITTSPAWTSKIRMMSTYLLDELRKNIKKFQYVTEISVVTAVLEESQKPATPHEKREISKTAKACLLQTADGIENQGLKRALLRLAQRYKEPGRK